MSIKSIEKHYKKINFIWDTVLTASNWIDSPEVTVNPTDHKEIGQIKFIGKMGTISDLPWNDTKFVVWLNPDNQPMFAWFAGLRTHFDLRYNLENPAPLNNATKKHMDRFLKSGDIKKELYAVNFMIKKHQENIKLLRREKAVKQISS